MGRLADAIAEGVQIADAAARMAVRNRILMTTIAEGADFDPETVTAFTRGTLTGLALEQERAGKALRKIRRRAWGKHSDPRGTHDYRDADTKNLRKREKQYIGVAEKLRKQADDPDAVSALIDSARLDAWGDVEANLFRRLDVEARRPDQDPDYARMRDARMEAVRLIDLSRLRSARRRVERASAALAADVAAAAEPA